MMKLFTMRTRYNNMTGLAAIVIIAIAVIAIIQLLPTMIKLRQQQLQQQGKMKTKTKKKVRNSIQLNNATIKTSNAIDSRYYCEWNIDNDTECQRMLLQLLQLPAAQSNSDVQQQQHQQQQQTQPYFVFMGDSTTFRLAYQLQMLMERKEERQQQLLLRMGNNSTIILSKQQRKRNKKKWKKRLKQFPNITLNDSHLNISRVQRLSGRCNRLQYYGDNMMSTYGKKNSTSSTTSSSTTSNDHDWIMPKKGEGPRKYALENPYQYCTDCSGCFNFHNSRMEFLAVEFTRDIEMQTLITNTTQQTVALYLSNNNKKNKKEKISMTMQHQPKSQPTTSLQTTTSSSYDADIINNSISNNNTNNSNNNTNTIVICVANVMLHDIRGIGERGENRYLRNLREYIFLLLHGRNDGGGGGGGCDKLVWVSTTSTVNNPKYPQKNYIISRWNNAVKNMLLLLKSDNDNDTDNELHNNDNDNRQRIYYMDVYNASLGYPHHDNVHLTDEWYSTLGKTFLKAIPM